MSMFSVGSFLCAGSPERAALPHRVWRWLQRQSRWHALHCAVLLFPTNAPLRVSSLFRTQVLVTCVFQGIGAFYPSCARGTRWPQALQAAYGCQEYHKPRLFMLQCSSQILPLLRFFRCVPRMCRARVSPGFVSIHAQN